MTVFKRRTFPHWPYKKGFYSSRNLIDKILHMILDVEILNICVLLSIDNIGLAS